MLGDAEVVERHGQQDGVGREQLVDQGGSQRDRGLLLAAVGLGGVPAGADRVRPGVRRQHVDADVPALDRVAGWAASHSASTMSAISRLAEPSSRMLASSRNNVMTTPSQRDRSAAHFNVETTLTHYKVEVNARPYLGWARG